MHFNIIREVKQRIARIFISIEELFLKARYLRNFVMTGTQNVDFTSDKQGCYFWFKKISIWHHDFRIIMLILKICFANVINTCTNIMVLLFPQNDTRNTCTMMFCILMTYCRKIIFRFFMFLMFIALNHFVLLYY